MEVQADSCVGKINSGTQTQLCYTKMNIINELLSKQWLTDDTLNTI